MDIMMPTTETPLPPSVQEAIDFGRSLPHVTVNHNSRDWLDEFGYAEVDFLVDGPDRTEVGTTWYPDTGSGQWRLQLAGWRTIADSETIHRLADWHQVQAFLIRQAQTKALIDALAADDARALSACQDARNRGHESTADQHAMKVQGFRVALGRVLAWRDGLPSEGEVTAFNRGRDYLDSAAAANTA